MSEHITQTHTRARKKNAPQTLERTLGIFAILTILIAWVTGYKLENAAVEPYLLEALPDTVHFEQLSGNLFAAYDKTKELIGYIGVGEANGYGGPLKVAVAVDLDGFVTGMAIVQHRETPAWYRKVKESGFIDSLIGKSYKDTFKLGEDVDGVTSATYTSRAIADSVMKASREIAGNQLGLPVPSKERPKVVFGIPEITLIGLFALGYFGHQRNFKYTKQLRWVGMLVGLVVLGFLYNAPLTLSYFNKFLLGFWPQWQTNLYWYLLIGGILFVFTVENNNPYCEWFCPFGAAQECMGLIGGAKVYSPGPYRDFFTWLRRGVVWVAILVALLFRSPGLTSYEVFGTLFSLLGSNTQFILLALVLIASMFIKRPWCAYLCPLKPVVDFIRMVRKWILEQWKTINRKMVKAKPH